MKCYHHNDLDGRCAAAIIFNFYYTEGIFIEVDYKDEIDVDAIKPDEEIIIVDFSFKPSVMEEVLKKTKRVIWIDHHKTAKEYPYLGHVGGLRDFEDKSRAGCELTWEYFCGDKEMPEAVMLIGDYDKWALKFQPDCFNFYEGMKLEQNGPKALVWGLLFGSTADPWVDEIKEHGEVAIKYRDNYCGEISKGFGYEIEIDGHKGFAMNLYGFGSKMFGAKFYHYDFCLAYVHDGKKYTVSLYSEKIDVSVIAKKNGGGGHFGASGFTCEVLPFKRL
jgi:uncharacterized protein